MGELQTEPFQFTFNGFLKVAFQGSRITSDAGLIEVDSVRPPEPQCLALAQATPERHRDERTQPMSAILPRTSRACCGVNGWTSCRVIRGAVTRVATLRETRPQRIA